MQASEDSIITGRLRLVLLSVECMRAMSRGDARAAQYAAGFTIPPDSSLLGKAHLARRIGMIEQDREQHPWMDRAIVRKDDNLMVGYISFHHKAPDPDLLGLSECAAELGYGIDAPYRSQGYARESALAMMGWAARRGVKTFCLSISPANEPSLRMAESMGFRSTAERMDETDGLEYVYSADAASLHL
jgi:RimJ/RimL family protein N-acetyltransferase